MDTTETSILFNQFYNAGTPAVADAGRITVGTEQDWTGTGTTQDGYMAFETAVDGTVTEQVRIESSGNVGIGTTDPAYALDVKGKIATGKNGTDGQLIIYSEEGATDQLVVFNPHADMTQDTTSYSC